MTTIAIGTGSIIRIWADVTKRHADGAIEFDVFNGGWRGWIKDGIVHVRDVKISYPAQILWEGKVPKPHGANYNDAINWIESQIQK